MWHSKEEAKHPCRGWSLSETTMYGKCDHQKTDGASGGLKSECRNALQGVKLQCPDTSSCVPAATHVPLAFLYIQMISNLKNLQILNKAGVAHAPILSL